jgi:phosphoribosylamine--glycine ligase
VRILVLGSGAREHAIITSLLTERDESGNALHEITAAPGNAGIATQVETVKLDASNASVVRD